MDHASHSDVQLTRPLTMILLSPVEGTAATTGATALGPLGTLVFLAIPPVGAAVVAAAFPVAARRGARPRPARTGLVSFMISSRDWSSFPCPDMVMIVMVIRVAS
jgi:hypothetical protein